MENRLTGVELIAQERTVQIEKHGYTLEHDQEHDQGQLINAAESILSENAMHYPHDWDVKKLYRILLKDRVDQLAIAGALIAAEIDRINHITGKEENL